VDRIPAPYLSPSQRLSTTDNACRTGVSTTAPRKPGAHHLPQPSRL